MMMITVMMKMMQYRSGNYNDYDKEFSQLITTYQTYIIFFSATPEVCATHVATHTHTHTHRQTDV